MGASAVARKLADPNVVNRMSNFPIMRALARLAVRGKLEMEKQGRELGKKSAQEEIKKERGEQVVKAARRVRERNTRTPKK